MKFEGYLLPDNTPPPRSAQLLSKAVLGTRILLLNYSQGNPIQQSVFRELLNRILKLGLEGIPVEISLEITEDLLHPLLLFIGLWRPT